MKGTILDIGEGTIHDGPGLRITVFFKGCPLRCRWCHTPEGQKAEPEMLTLPGGLSRRVGRIWESRDLAAHLNDLVQLLPCNGGLTFSGGEPLMQSPFLLELLPQLTPGIHTLLDTCGFAPEKDFLAAAKQMKMVFFGLKLIDEKACFEWTKQTSAIALNNLKILDAECTAPYRLRIPLLAGVTDTEEQLTRLAELCSKLKRYVRVDFLPSNPHAGAKYPSCGRTFEPGFDVKATGRIPDWFQSTVNCKVLAPDEIE